MLCILYKGKYEKSIPLHENLYVKLEIGCRYCNWLISRVLLGK